MSPWFLSLSLSLITQKPLIVIPPFANSNTASREKNERERNYVTRARKKLSSTRVQDFAIERLVRLKVIVSEAECFVMTCTSSRRCMIRVTRLRTHIRNTACNLVGVGSSRILPGTRTPRTPRSCSPWHS